jgi:ABC-type multidrug transport system fused ATPase/permease subunit
MSLHRLNHCCFCVNFSEKGINLSGGQKARIALARACYRGADIFILDDVLAAVDVHVGKHLFKKCICGAMAGSTRVLVTNALHVLPSCDSVSVVDNGTVAEHGPYAELVEKRGGLLASMVEAHSIKEDELDEETEQETAPEEQEGTNAVEGKQDNHRAVATDQEAKSGVLVKEEKRKKGKVGLDVYRRYLSAGASDCLVGSILIFGFIMPESMSGLASVWLSVWTSADVTTFSDTLYYLSIYGAITIGAMGLVFARAFTWAAVVVQAAGKIHARLLARVLRFPLSFFDTTPTGRILNRFAHDVDQVDTQISQALEQQMEWSLRAAIALVLVCSILPSIIIFMLPILWSLNKVGQLFRYTSREVRRLDSTTRSPIYAHFSETLSGLSTIRSFGDNHRFVLQNEDKVEENLRVWFCHQLTHRWLNMRFDLISLVLQAAAAISCVYFRQSMSSGLVGVVMVQSFSSIRAFRLTLKTYVDVESKMTYAERVFEYSDMPTEPPAKLEDDPTEGIWPRDGQIEFRGVSMRYREK